MKQETLEEVAEKYKYNPKGDFCFTKGAKYQQEKSYSEEEVYELLYQHTCELFKKEPQTLEEFFNKFKKK